MRWHLTALLLLVAAWAAACGTDEDAAPGSAGHTVVATTTQAADLARNVAGDDARVIGLLQPNADPHGYELRPSDVEILAQASVIVRSGGDLDGWLDDAVETSGSDAEVVTLIDSVDTIEGGHDHGDHAGEEVDPHWWHDPRNAVAAVGAIEAALSRERPDAAADYAANAERYSARIEALDEAVAACWAKVPPERRKLVTTHDALGYYAERYGLEVIGTVIPSLSTQGQPSAGELRELAVAIRAADAAVIFAESSVSTKVQQALAQATDAAVGRPLWADSLGPEGSPGATYLGAIAANTDALIDGLGGGEVSCTLPGGA